MTAIETAYASNSETPLETFEFIHPGINDQIRLFKGEVDIVCTLEDSNVVTFTRSNIKSTAPSSSSDGSQSVTLQIDNVSNEVWTQLKQIINYNRATPGTQSEIILKYRRYLESDLTTIVGETVRLKIIGSGINRNIAQFEASYALIPDVRYPNKFYYTNTFPGLKYV